MLRVDLVETIICISIFRKNMNVTNEKYEHYMLLTSVKFQPFHRQLPRHLDFRTDLHPGLFLITLYYDLISRLLMS